jgi:hypothetical protein
LKAAALTLAGLALLLLAAHFYRSGAMVPTGLSLAAIALLFVRSSWSRRALQLVLVLGALEWVRTAFRIAEVRALHEAPWLRMALILGAVATLTTVAAALLQTPALERHFQAGNGRDRPP